jgi:dTDP-glucose 4,6-dehydratase
MTRILITGGCGFLGHHVVEHIIRNTDWEVVVWDKLTYASNGFDRLRDVGCFDENRVQLLQVDLGGTDGFSPGVLKETNVVDYVLHLAAETHVDRSIEDPKPFLRSNVLGTQEVLEWARWCKDTAIGPKRIIYMSTDEVFGPAPPGVYYEEDDRYNCTNPYAASKAGAEQLCVAYANCYDLPILIVRSMNLFGERQHPEKYVPGTLKKVLAGEKVIIHADPTKITPGSRFYIHCRNVAAALVFLLRQDLGPGEKVNIVGEQEVDNLTMARWIAKLAGKDLKYELVDFHGSRPGHDLRYSLDGAKLADLGWKTPVGFQESLENTIRWMMDNPRWLENWT